MDDSLFRHTRKSFLGPSLRPNDFFSSEERKIDEVRPIREQRLAVWLREKGFRAFREMRGRLIALNAVSLLPHRQVHYSSFGSDEQWVSERERMLFGVEHTHKRED